MFKIGDLVYLRPVSLHTPGVLNNYDGDINILRYSYSNMRRGMGDRILWFVRDYIDWNTECFLPRPVYITDASSYGRDSVEIYYEMLGIDTWHYNTWWIKSAALEYAPVITQTRRLTVKRGS